MCPHSESIGFRVFWNVNFERVVYSAEKGSEKDNSQHVAPSLRVIRVGTRLTVHRSLSVLGGKICIVSYVWLSVSSFGTIGILFYMLNLFWRSLSFVVHFSCCLVKKSIFFKFEILNFGHLFQMGLALRVTPAGTWLTVHRRLSRYCCSTRWAQTGAAKIGKFGG